MFASAFTDRFGGLCQVKQLAPQYFPNIKPEAVLYVTDRVPTTAESKKEAAVERNVSCLTRAPYVMAVSDRVCRSVVHDHTYCRYLISLLAAWLELGFRVTRKLLQLDEFLFKRIRVLCYFFLSLL